ncbi:hypothetical protein [Thermococcus gorgonarius]|uniref:Uncharacterized protein n=1 Tax=Thermococcus gorgonarius TaxID=71997 RepID=A0A2Z2M8T0_THEGO|nr:hypothetical protein [Thermococcus gorgonarius]ASJ00885.1 hypothetical protein A3K92_05010 [Thermococcus gorgonarius]
MKVNEGILGVLLYTGGILLALFRPPVDRAACITFPGGKGASGINPFFLALELGMVIVGSVLLALEHDFKNSYAKNGWIGVTSGLGAAIIGGHSNITAVFLFGVALATPGLIAYKVGGRENAGG